MVVRESTAPGRGGVAMGLSVNRPPRWRRSQRPHPLLGPFLPDSLPRRLVPSCNGTGHHGTVDSSRSSHPENLPLPKTDPRHRNFLRAIPSTKR